jgi:hypothetical protein
LTSKDTSFNRCDMEIKKRVRRKTWEVVKMGEGFEPSGEIELQCPGCGHDAALPFREWPENMVIASTGLTLYYDHPGMKPPFRQLPDEIRCRKCHRRFEKEV